MDNYHILIEIIADATFSWLKCDSCVKESTKMNEERYFSYCQQSVKTYFRVKTGASAALTMINKLHKRKRNTTGFLKTFFTLFWDYVTEVSAKCGKYYDLDENSAKFNNLTNSLDLIGKVL